MTSPSPTTSGPPSTSAGANLDLLRLLVVREVRVRYARAALGVAWAAFLPLVMLGIFTLLPGVTEFVAASPYADTPYAAFAFCGLVFWMHFQQAVLTGTSSLAVAHDILHKSRFPSELIPLARVLSWFFDLAIGVALLLGLLLLQGVDVPATALLVPVFFLLQIGFTVGCALLFSALNLFFRDVHYILQALMPLLMLASNVVWPLDGIEGTKGSILRANPIVSYLESYRYLLFRGELPPWDRMAAGVIGAVLALVVGWAYFRRVRHRFAEEV